jgi:hypothetical protein
LPCTSAAIFSEWKLYYIASFDDDDGEGSTNYAFEEDDEFIQTGGLENRQVAFNLG